MSRGYTQRAMSAELRRVNDVMETDYRIEFYTTRWAQPGDKLRDRVLLDGETVFTGTRNAAVKFIDELASTPAVRRANLARRIEMADASARDYTRRSLESTARAVALRNELAEMDA